MPAQDAVLGIGLQGCAFVCRTIPQSVALGWRSAPFQGGNPCEIPCDILGNKILRTPSLGRRNCLREMDWETAALIGDQAVDLFAFENLEHLNQFVIGDDAVAHHDQAQ